ncbi:MAG: signal recognition particle-docking protein FtsY [Actinobacteria bacterium]|nr:signal recognition particle-docking protein FtsY [Actinomycetota bacterium]
MGIFARFFEKVASLRGEPTQEEVAEIQATLIAADIGPTLTQEIINLVKRERGDLALAVKSELMKCFVSNSRELIRREPLTTFMVVGVNGTGKTTSVAKIAERFHRSGERVLLTAADTFRAAAIEQLSTWADRIGVAIHSSTTGSDPASVAFDGAKRAMSEGFTVHIIDTAGRLHTMSNLMSELGKVKRVAEKVSSVDEVLLVLDGTVGQNAIVQAREFMGAVPITGLVLTKMDGSAKGGALLAIERELSIPIKLIGTGEKVSDLEIFEPALFLDRMLAS